MPRFRMGRINSQLQREISLILSREVRDEKLAEVIVTSVECSKDLKYAKVYYTTDAPRLPNCSRKFLATCVRRSGACCRTVPCRN